MESKLSFFVFILALLTFLNISCQKDSVPQIEIVARVDGHLLTREELSNLVPPEVPEEQKEAISRQYIDRWIRQTILSIAAKNDDISLSDYQQWVIKNLEKEILAQKYLETKLPKQINITDEEISIYYKKNKEEFKRDVDEVHLIQLFLENLDGAITREIQERKSLLEVIRKNYLDSQINRLLEHNGDLGYVPIDNLRKEIIKRVKSGSTGRIYGPIKIESGYYYFQMMDKQPKGSYCSIDLVKPVVQLRLTNIKRDELAQNITKQLLAKYDVEIFTEHVK